MNRALTTGTMNTDVMMLPDYSGSASVIEPEKMSPMDSLKAIFEDMRDSLNTLVELAQSQGPSAADLRDQDISDADVVPDPGSDTDSQGNSGFPALEMPKIGPKVGLALMLIGLSALFKYGDEIAAALEPVLKYGKEFYDNLSPTGKIGLGVAGLAALVFPGTLTTLVKTGVGLAFDGLKLGFTTMKDAITSMPGLMKAGYQKGKELLGGAFGLLLGTGGAGLFALYLAAAVFGLCLLLLVLLAVMDKQQLLLLADYFPTLINGLLVVF